MRYIPHTEQDVASMLRLIGAPSVESLFAHIPAALRPSRPLDIPALDEVSLLGHLGELGSKSTPAVADTPREGAALAFLGAGITPHHIPVAVDALLWRAEWYTSYTPYQPEVAQGTLQAIFEYQTIVSELLGPTPAPGAAAPFVSNASMYDGASGTAEAVLMARRVTGRTRAIVCGALHPQYVETLHCYLAGLQEDRSALYDCVGFGPDGRVDKDALATALQAGGETTACVVVQTPNFLGVIEDVPAVARLAAAARSVPRARWIAGRMSCSSADFQPRGSWRSCGASSLRRSSRAGCSANTTSAEPRSLERRSLMPRRWHGPTPMTACIWTRRTRARSATGATNWRATCRSTRNCFSSARPTTGWPRAGSVPTT